jgi:hypothetical protein
MAFARGKYAKAISDRSGMEFPYSEMVKEWNGMFVHKSEYEAKQPQLDPRPHGADPQALENVRTDRTENKIIAILGSNPFKTIAASSGIINVSEFAHGRSTGDTVRFRGAPSTSATFNNPKTFDGIAATNLAKAAGYSITVGKRDSSGNVTQTADFYHFTVDTNTATSGNISGGGENCSAGPATLTA